jgi:hypothetical protein
MKVADRRRRQVTVGLPMSVRRGAARPDVPEIVIDTP